MFIPVGEAPHRTIEADPGAKVRLEMCELAVAGDERFEVSRMELERPGPSYTVDTLRALRDEAPDDELFLILGGDQAASLPRWREPEEVLSLATVAVFERGGWSRSSIVVDTVRLRGAERVRFLDMPRIEVSSTLVRGRVARGRPIRYLVPEKVAELIERTELYRAGAPATPAAPPSQTRARETTPG
jgi:nicotinate-nucleotide adenylyltransferase